MKKNLFFFLFGCMAILSGSHAQSLSKRYAALLTRPEGYVCLQPSGPINVDGLADEPSWRQAPVTTAFVDISGTHLPTPRYTTTARMLWDEEYLYVYAEMEEPHIWANLTKRDTIVYYDNDFEVFIDTGGDGHNYFEIETNARETVFDLSLTAPYRAPQRPFVQFQWDCPGLKLAVHHRGTLNRPDDVDEGWAVEMAIPAAAIAREGNSPLKAGHYLRLNFSRVEWQHDIDAHGRYDRKKKGSNYLPEDNWVWSPTGRIAMHMPERWGYVFLADQKVDRKAGEKAEAFAYPADEPLRRFLWMLFYAQEEQYEKTGTYYKELSEFGLQPADMQLLPSGYAVTVETTRHTYEITASLPGGKALVINESGRCFPRTLPLPVYVWQSWDEATTVESLKADFARWKSHGVTGVCFNTGFDTEKARVAAQTAKSLGLEYQAWAPCMLQSELPASWYAVNRLGQSAHDVQAYVPYYKFLDPLNPEVQEWLTEQYIRLADIPELDYVQLDYIRYADVILARGLWDKYGLVMDEEYPAADYCYCDRCTKAFKAKTGIDIHSVEDPAKCAEWAQFRCDVITALVGKISAAVRAKGKKVSADVFPGPHSYARWMVRQEWGKWDVDALFPMNYNDFYLEGTAWIEQVVREEVNAVAGRVPVYSGLFICRDWKNKDKVIDPENSGLLPSEIEEAINRSINAGAAGISLFTPHDMTDEHWEAFERTLRKLNEQ